MTKEESKTTNHTAGWGAPFCFLTTLVFLVLKLTHVIDWNWWWIFAPLWIPTILVMLIIIIIALVVTGKK